jgi:zinc/manganese transport system permease protein
MLADALSLLWLPFAATVAFVVMHAWLGVHVLRRRIVFADLALAQLSALGGTVAFAAGHPAGSLAAFAYALAFTALGALALTALRRLARYITQEAFIGILYVVATAATIIVVDRSPQGAEHVKRMLVGSLLAVSEGDVVRLYVMYVTIGALHWLLRRPMLAASAETEGHEGRDRWTWAWDLIFFLSFGLVVTSSVSVAGVLLVFSFLIVPPLVGSFFFPGVGAILRVGCSVGWVASAVGLVSAYLLDLPTGAAIVTTLALSLLFAALVRYLFVGGQGAWRGRGRAAAKAVIASTLLVVLGSSLWLIVNPAGDQPLLSFAERATGIGPARFLNENERGVYEDASRDSRRFQGEVERLNAMERTARYRGAVLSDEEVRRIASYQQTFNEMTRGERFVTDVLQAKARAVERWVLGVPAALLASLGLLLLRRF